MSNFDKKKNKKKTLNRIHTKKLSVLESHTITIWKRTKATYHLVRVPVQRRRQRQGVRCKSSSWLNRPWNERCGVLGVLQPSQHHLSQSSNRIKVNQLHLAAEPRLGVINGVIHTPAPSPYCFHLIGSFVRCASQSRACAGIFAGRCIVTSQWGR